MTVDDRSMVLPAQSLLSPPAQSPFVFIDARSLFRERGNDSILRSQMMALNFGDESTPLFLLL
jgi:hypothetical protein